MFLAKCVDSAHRRQAQGSGLWVCVRALGLQYGVIRTFRFRVKGLGLGRGFLHNCGGGGGGGQSHSWLNHKQFDL